MREDFWISLEPLETSKFLFGFFLPSAGRHKILGLIFSFFFASFYRPQDGTNFWGLIFSFFLASFYRPQDGTNFWGLIFSLACVAFVAFGAFVAVLKIHCDYAQFPKFCLFTKLSEPRIL